MEFFNEINSLSFRSICHLFNAAVNGGRFTRRELQDYMQKSFISAYAILERDERDFARMMFDFSSPGPEAKPWEVYPGAVPLVFSELERRWLKTMLLDEKAGFLLSDGLREKLLGRLRDIRPLPLELWERRQAVGDDPAAEPLRSLLRAVWQAFRQRKKIHYRNLTAAGTVIEAVASPCRLEYDIAMNRYYLIIWNHEEERAVKVAFSRLLALEPVAEEIPAGLLDKVFPDFLQERQQTVRLKLLPKNNAIDRCLSLFSSYDKSEAFFDEAGSCHLTLYFYDFDRREIIEKILTLGSAAIVLEPVPMREEVVAAFRQAYELYE